jgi:hypothetical protein
MLELSSVMKMERNTGSRNTTEFEDNDPMDGAIVRESSEGSKSFLLTLLLEENNRWSKRQKNFVWFSIFGVMEYPLPSGVFVEVKFF